jgi:hypothetical protein
MDIMNGKTPCKDGDEKLRRALRGLQKEAAEQAVGSQLPAPRAGIKGPGGQIINDTIRGIKEILPSMPTTDLK